jgi:uncharacterized membrane protein YuzA (DUF378 family)
MEFVLIGGVIVLLGLAGVPASRRSYTLIGLAALVASLAILVRS